MTRAKAYRKQISNLKHLGMTSRMTLNVHSVGQEKKNL